VADEGEQLDEQEPNTLLMLIGSAAFALLLCLGAAGYFVVESWGPPAHSPAGATAPAADGQGSKPAVTPAGARSKAEPEVVVQPAPGMRVPSGKPKIRRHVDLERINPLGEVYAGWGSEELLSTDWTQLLLTKATVAVPEGAAIRLNVDWDATDISALLKVQPDDLDVLDLSRATLDSATLAPVSHLTGLRALRLEGAGIDDRALKHLQGLRSLEILDLHNCPITDAGLDTIARLPGLRALYLRQVRITPTGLKKIGRMKKLTHLQLLNMPIADQDLAALANMPKLVNLRLASNGLSDQGLVWLKNLRSLRVLELVGNHVHGSGLASLRGATLLWINLGESDVDDAGLTGIVGINGPITLFLDKTGITDLSVPTLLRLPQLQNLNLAQTRLTDAGATRLEGMKSLKLLNLPSQIGPATRAKLEKLMPQCKIDQADGWPFH